MSSICARYFCFFFFKQKTAYEMRISDWSSDVCSSDLFARERTAGEVHIRVFNPNLEAHGWDSPHTALQIVNDDMPFLVDSVTMALAQAGASIYVLGHRSEARRVGKECVRKFRSGGAPCP